jgi:hypothetical protein
VPRLGRPATGDAGQLVGEAVNDLRVPGDLGQRPGESQGRRVVAGDQDRYECVPHLAVPQRRAVLVRRGEQVVEYVLASRRVAAPPPCRDEGEEVVVEVA